MLAFKAGLKAQGWSVTRTSDGITFSSSSDILTHGGSGAGGLDNANAFFVAAAPAPSTQSFVFYRGADALNWGIWSSGAAGFTGGSTSSLPTATDGFDAFSTSFAYMLPTPPFDLKVGVEVDVPHRWYFLMDAGFLGKLMVASIGVPGGKPIIQWSIGFGGLMGSWQPDDTTATEALYEMITSIGSGVGGGGGGPADTTGPTIDGFSPSDGSSIARADAVSVDVADDTAIGLVLLSVQLADGTVVTAYDGSSFVGPFAAGSSFAGHTYTLEYDAPGWPSSAIDVLVTAIDTSGNVSTGTVGYTISDAPSAPTVGPFSPSDGGNTTRTGTVTVDVTHADGRPAIASVGLSATLADGSVRTIYTGGAFVGAFTAGSARTNTTNGYTYSIVHASPGWPSSTLAFTITAVDVDGRTTTHTTYNLAVTDAPAAPVIGSFSPSAGSVARADNVDFTVTCPDGFSKIVVYADLADGSTVMVYTGSGFGGQVNAASTVSGTTTQSFSITYDGDGWTDDYTLRVIATSSLGLTSTASSAYTLSDAPEPVVPDTTAPEVSFTLPDMTTIQKNDAVPVDVTDNTGLALVWITAQYASGQREVIYEPPEPGQNGYSPLFVSKSTKQAISGGQRFTLRRTGGWPSTPTIRVRPYDSALNEG